MKSAEIKAGIVLGLLFAGIVIAASQMPEPSKVVIGGERLLPQPAMTSTTDDYKVERSVGDDIQTYLGEWARTGNRLLDIAEGFDNSSRETLAISLAMNQVFEEKAFDTLVDQGQQSPWRNTCAQIHSQRARTIEYLSTAIRTSDRRELKTALDSYELETQLAAPLASRVGSGSHN